MLVPPAGPPRVMAQFYFFFFMSMAAYGPYFGVFLREAGLSGTHIGIILALPPLVAIFIQPVWGALGDILGNRSRLLILVTCATALVALFYPFNQSFAQLFGITLVFALFNCAVMPLADTIALEAAETGVTEYGRMRLWGSIGYASVVALIGRLLDWTGTGALFWLYSGILLLAAYTAWRLPPTRAEHGAFSINGIHGLLKTPTLAAFLTGTFVLQVSFIASINFYGIHMQNLGASKLLIGIAWALAAITEIPVMHNAASLVQRFGSRPVLLFSFINYACRTLIFALALHPGVAMAAQTLNGFSFGLFYTSAVTYIGNIAPSGLRTSGQTLFWAVLSLGAVVGNVTGGILMDIVGLRGVFTCSTAGILLAAVLVFTAMGEVDAVIGRPSRTLRRDQKQSVSI